VGDKPLALFRQVKANMVKKLKALKKPKKLTAAKKLEKKTTLRPVDVLVPRLPV